MAKHSGGSESLSGWVLGVESIISSFAEGQGMGIGSVHMFFGECSNRKKIWYSYGTTRAFSNRLEKHEMCAR